MKKCSIEICGARQLLNIIWHANIKADLFSLIFLFSKLFIIIISEWAELQKKKKTAKEMNTRSSCWTDGHEEGVFWGERKRKERCLGPTSSFASQVTYLGSISQILTQFNDSFMYNALQFICGFRKTCCHSCALWLWLSVDVAKFVGNVLHW